MLCHRLISCCCKLVKEHHGPAGLLEGGDRPKATMAAEPRRLPRLPACRHCSTKKIKVRETPRTKKRLVIAHACVVVRQRPSEVQHLYETRVRLCDVRLSQPGVDIKRVRSAAIMGIGLSQFSLTLQHRYLDKLEKRAERLANTNGSTAQRETSEHQASPAHTSPEKINTGRSLGSSAAIVRGAGIRSVARRLYCH